MPGVEAPDRYPIRDPRDTSLTNGKTANPPRMIEVGGLGDQGKWFKGYIADEQIGNKHDFPVESGGPTGVKSTHSAVDSDDD